MAHSFIPAAKIPTPFLGQTQFIHGGDYNPDQWMSSVPGILEEDAGLMKLAGINSATVGVFSWTMMEPWEGQFEFGWLDRVFDQQAKLGNKVVLATPSGSMPAWIAEKYPTSRRVDKKGLRCLFGGRHNHCWTSPQFRERVASINQQLAERYRSHPALAMWHVSNELNGHCYCDTCRSKWAGWLETKFGTLKKLNDAYWTGFWSRTATRWTEVEPTDEISDGLLQDWFRFNNDQLIDWYNFEAAILRKATPNIPITTNFMGTNFGLDYQRIGTVVDVIADDQYPYYDPDSERFVFSAAFNSFKQDLYRNFRPKGVERSMFLMESCPGAVQWKPPQKMKRPGLHRLEMLQAVAGGCDGTSYFQFRASRNATEKMHGSVVEHAGTELAPKTRVFREVQALSATYAKLTAVLGTTVRAEVAMVYDWDSKWGQKFSCGTGIGEWHYDAVAVEQYLPFWSAGIPVDVIPPDRSFEGYKVLILPMLWTMTPMRAHAIQKFVEGGGTVVATFDTAICDEHNRMLQGGTPGAGLTEVFGLWVEETDRLDETAPRALAGVKGNSLGLIEKLSGRQIAAISHLESANAIATFADDFYAGHAAISVNTCGKGKAYFLATRLDEGSATAFYSAVAAEAGLAKVLDGPLPAGVTAQIRGAGNEAFVFLLNFSKESKKVPLGEMKLVDAESGEKVAGSAELLALGARVFRVE